MQLSTRASSADPVVDYATGWDMEDEEEMKEIERRVMDEEPLLLIGSPFYSPFGT